MSDFSGGAKLVVEKAVRQLLETKHLYQGVEIEVAELGGIIDEVTFRETRKVQALSIFSTSAMKTEAEIKAEAWGELKAFLDSTPFEFRSPGTGGQEGHLAIFVPTVMAVCQNKGCIGVWPHNMRPDLSCGIQTIKANPVHQIFLLQYQCQSCKNEPVSFLVKRDGARLALAGRSPIEKVVTPTFIPQKIRKYYRGAVIAFNSGAILPAIFMLRTMIEQHMRLALNAGHRRMTGEELVDEYADTLGPAFNRQFQSLRPVYATLSEAIHAAVDDKPQIFEAAHAEILRHFEAKDVVERLSVAIGSGTSSDTGIIDQPQT